MRNLLTLLFVLALVATGLSAQGVPSLPSATPPESADEDKCYALCYIPQKWETVTENVETYGAGSRLVVAAPEYETITEQVMVKPASYRLVSEPADYTTEEVTIEVEPAHTTYTIEEAKFEYVTERVLIEEGTTVYEPGAPQFSTVTNANLYYGSPNTEKAFVSTDYGNVLDPSTRKGVTGPNDPFNPANPNSLLNDPNSPMNASPSTYGSAGTAALLDPDNPNSPFSDSYIKSNGLEASVNRANEILAESGVGAIAPYLETESRVQIDRIPREFETVTEEVEVQPAYVTFEQAPGGCGSGDCLTWCAVEVPAQFQTVNRRVAKDCPADYTIASTAQGGEDYCVRVSYTPAVYGARQIMTAGPTIEKRTTEPRYREVRVRKMVSPAKVIETEVPAKTETITKRVVSREAYTRYELVPAEYKSVTRRVRRGLKDAEYFAAGGVFLAPSTYGSTAPGATDGTLPMALNPAAGYPVDGTTLPIRVGEGPDRAGNIEAPGFGQVSSDIGSIPAGMPSTYYTAGCPEGYQFDPRDGLCKATESYSAKNETITKRVPAGTGNFQDWKEVLCPQNVSPVSIRELQNALNRAGYPAGVADGIMGSKTKAALAKYQRDNDLPIGGMNMATLKKLGLRK